MRVPAVKMWAAAGLAVIAAVAFGAVPAQAATLPFGTVRSIVQQVPFSTQNPKTFALGCNPGERVLGGGVFTVGGVHAVITEMQPIHPVSGVDSFQVTAAATSSASRAPGACRCSPSAPWCRRACNWRSKRRPTSRRRRGPTRRRRAARRARC